MPRIARVIAPDYPHHIIQRGNRRQPVFFSDRDKNIYMKLFKEQSERYGLQCWAYCLMDNHVHFIVVPRRRDSFKAVSETDRRYTTIIHSREDWRGYLWQGRFLSFVMDEGYCYQAVKYVENNPVRAGIVNCAEEYLYSSARSHVYNTPDRIVTSCFLQDMIKDWRSYLGEGGQELDQIRKHSRTGRPLGDEEFIGKLECVLGRSMQKKRPGPKIKRELSKVSP